ncbi:MFS transporter [Dictyoglomus thermophilum]|uniref:MFS transporter n=1 Tax=Dictyoglomus thermophilum TaxID=14 RepID=A0A7V3ZJG5_DICTH|nr:MFS transporter [Dictyoglomus thermophilum]TYT23308.1 MFS transporter [Dictyoglomus thermophilum]
MKKLNLFRALRSRNYKLYFSGQAISLIGTWIQSTAMSWLVYRLTNSSVLLGTTAFLSQIPNLFISPFVGVFLDRFSKHKILILTQTLLMFQALILSILTLTNTIQIWHILLLSLVLGIINSIDAPTRQSFVIEMVERPEDLNNAIALNSLLFNVARLIGPTISGFLIALIGEGMCFLINALSYLAVIIALLFMEIKVQIPVISENIIKDLKAGFSYAFNFIVVRYILIFISLSSIFASIYSVLMPIFAKDILHGGPETLGILTGATGAGALIGAIYLAGRSKVKGIENILSYSFGTAGIGLLIFSLSRNIYTSILALFVTGLSFMLNSVCSNTLIQNVIENHIRGRVMSIYVMFFMGSMPIGSYIGGLLAKHIGAVNTVLLSGILCLICSLIYKVRLPILREYIYSILDKRGIS